MQLCFFCILLTINGCKENVDNSESSTKEYFVAGNHWKSNQAIQKFSDLSFTASEIPKQYYLMKNKVHVKASLDSLVTTMAGERIIEFQIGAESGHKALLELDSESSRYLSQNIAEDFSVVTKTNDTISCIGVHLEQSHQMAPFKRLLLYFNNVNSEEQIKLLYRDKIFGKGKMNFEFKYAPVKL